MALIPVAELPSLKSPKEIDRQLYYYMRHLETSTGFKVPDIGRNDCLYGMSLIRPYDFQQDECVRHITEVAIERYNQQKGMDLKLKEIQSVNLQPGYPGHYYITFLAVDSSSSVGTYQSLIVRGGCDEKTGVILFRAEP